jgi:hypothetical protein
MASLKEAFADQSDFYNDQQLKYTDIEPNRFQPNAVSGVTESIISGVYDQLGNYDPYTEETIRPITKAGVRKLLQGQTNNTKEELECRTYIGLGGLIRLMDEVDSNSPVRCGWRYTKAASPGQSQGALGKGALGTRNGPLNANEDVLEFGTTWFWDLNDAVKTYLRDIAKTLTSENAMNAYNAAYPLPLPQFKWCASTQKVYPVNLDGSAKYPRDTNFSCPPLTGNALNPIIRGQVAGQAAAQVSAAAEAKASCSNPGANTFLSRDCFLQAVKDNGCSDKGTLFRSLQSENPSGSRWDTYLKTTRAFIDYQSKQGANGITDALFQRNKSVWSEATAPITKLQNAMTQATDPQVKAAAKDLCNMSGFYDTYDFCSDIADGTSIGAVDFSCIQRYWQEKDGKPAGTAYPKSRNFDAQLGTPSPSTWKMYKTAVDTLKTTTKSRDPVVQRRAIDAFYGVRIGTNSFSPTTINSNIFELTSPPCFGYGSPGTGALAGMRLYTKSECDAMNGISYWDGQCLVKTGGSYTWNCRRLNEFEAANTLVLWLDAKDGSTLTLDGTGSVKTWKDKSGKGNDIIQNANGPTYRGGENPFLQFNGNNSRLDLPRPFSLVRNFFTIFIVEQRTSSKPYNCLLGGSQGGQNMNLVVGYRYDRNVMMAFWANDLDVNPGCEAFKQGSEPLRIWCLHFSSSGRAIYINGRLIGSDRNTSPLNNWEGGSIGNYAGNFYAGNIFEVLIYNTALDSNAKRQTIEGYLAWKWGLQANLDTTHPHKNVAP